MTQNLGDAVLTLRADGKPLDADMDGAQRNVGGRMKSMGAGMAVAGGAMTLAITRPLIGFAKTAADELEQIQASNAQTTAALGRMDGTLLTMGGVQKLAGELQKLSGIDDQAIQGAQNMILTLGALDTSTQAGADTFDTASRAAVNMAEAMKMDVGAAGKQIAKSMAAASEGTLLLPRSMKLGGEATKKLEAQLAKTSDAGERQALVAEAIGQKFAGAANLTANDKWEILEDRFAGIGAALLTQLLPYVERFTGFLSRALGYFEGLSPTMQKVVAVGLALVAALGPILLIGGSLMMVLPAIGALFTALLGPVGLIILGIVAVGAALITLWRKNEAFRNGVKAAWADVRSSVSQILTQLKATLSQWVAWAKQIWAQHGEQIKQTASAAFGAMRTIIEGRLKTIKGYVQMWLGIFRGDWGAAWNGLKTMLSGVWDTIKGIVSLALTGIKAVWSVQWNSLKAIVSAAWNGIVAAVKAAGSKLTSAISSLVGDAKAKAYEIGTAIIDGIVQGIKAGAGRIASAAKGAANDALNSAKGALGINSPSKVMHDKVGVPIAEGIAAGITKGGAKVTKATKNLVSKLDAQLTKAALRFSRLMSGLDLASALAGDADAAKLQAKLDANKTRIASLQGVMNSKGISRTRRMELEQEIASLARENTGLQGEINGIAADAAEALNAKTEQAKEDARALADAQHEAENLRREALGLMSQEDEAKLDAMNAIRASAGLVALKPGESASATPTTSKAPSVAATPGVSITQNFASNPDPFVASRRAQFAAATAGMVPS